ncbi:hypothetical protein AURDEDRAFT_146929 [Auricularia subglabra TFB-10046 SS5]|uniref:Uncharacterized protein n=1 Tax=Auricularia subglabra (strain TFB-10046 / SS5) TaxID=717982 RepID=J0LI32_AURST|nr:hypothetical protein AURDEDRAFT_146929 [Auricularia subglabra TFB-10046 SS5]
MEAAGAGRGDSLDSKRRSDRHSNGKANRNDCASPFRQTPPVPNDLRARSIEQEAAISKETYADRSDLWRLALAALMRDEFIALDKDKCEFVYTLQRATSARDVVEGGVGMIYLALGVGQGGKVIATENDRSKAEQARVHWRRAGEQVEKVIELREGDLLQTLKTDVPQIDFLLLDSRSSDDTVSHAKRCAPFLAVVIAPDGPFRSLVLPYSSGLELSAYLP